MKEFQEKDAIKAMRSALSPEASARIDDDELLNIIDIIWDWYDDQGLLEIDAEADSEDVNTDALVSHVHLVAAQLRYEQSLEDEI